MTDIFIPLELQELLELGPTNSIGGYVQHEGSDIFVALNALHTKIKKDARKQNIDEFSSCRSSASIRTFCLCNVIRVKMSALF